MSPELERLLREARRTLPDPEPAVTKRTRARVVRAAARRRRIALGLVTAIILATGAGVAVLLWPSAGTATGGQVVFGAGFLPADGWNTVQRSFLDPRRGGAALTANVPLASGDMGRGPGVIPRATLETLPPHGVVVAAVLRPRLGGPLAVRKLPLRLADARPVVVAGFPARRIRASVAAYDLEVLVFVGSRAALPAAQRQLDRLVVEAEEVTIRAQGFEWDNEGRPRRITLSGTVASGKAGQTVGIMLRECGEPHWALVGGTQTATGGAWFASSHEGDFAFGIGWYRARWEGKFSEPVIVRWPAVVRLERKGRTFTVTVELPNGAGRLVDLQRKTLTGWVRVRRARLTEARPRGGFFHPHKASFVVRTRGLTLRAFVSAKTAAPCYSAGVSNEIKS